MLNDDLQRALKSRLEACKAERMQIADAFTSGQFSKLADKETTLKRLRSKGLDKEATQYSRAMAVPESFGKRSGLESAPASPDANRIVKESIIGADDQLSVQFLHRGSEAAYSVGRIVTSPRAPNGTGFLISPRLLMTNNHVLASAEQASNNFVEFEYGDAHGKEPTAFQFQPDEFFVTSHWEELDCTVVAVAPVNQAGATLDRFPIVTLQPDQTGVQVGERVNIIHHPGGGLKQVSIRDNFVAGQFPAEDPAYWLYASDTERGSSGSPVFDEQWNVVALHHAGINVTERDEVDRYRSILQSLGVAGIDESHSVQLNEGIRINKILEWLSEKASSFSAEQRALYEQISQSSHPSQSLHVAGTRPLEGGGGSSSHSLSTMTGDSGGPVTLNFFFGGSAPQTVQVPSQHDHNVVSKKQLELFKNNVSSQKSVFRALSVLQREREEPYLPTNEQIKRRQEEYYEGLFNQIADDDLPGDIYDQLHVLLSDNLTIATKFPERMQELDSLVSETRTDGAMVILESGTQYARSRAHLYTNVDLQPHRMLQCPYTDTILAPEQLMLKDLIVEVGQKDLLPSRMTGGNKFLNCEHIVPKSWFKSAHPKGISDLHHLISADGGANQFRSDSAFRELGSRGELGPSKRPVYIKAAGRQLKSEKKFEPSKGKHVVARATLYFLVCYKGAISSEKYDSDAIETLKKWSRDTPPGDYEKHRNETIFDVQGNRNPFIDFPELVDKVDFTLGLS